MTATLRSDCHNRAGIGNGRSRKELNRKAIKAAEKRDWLDRPESRYYQLVEFRVRPADIS
jgi:hypothetical protein